MTNQKSYLRHIAPDERATQSFQTGPEQFKCGDPEAEKNPEHRSQAPVALVNQDLRRGLSRARQVLARARYACVGRFIFGCFPLLAGCAHIAAELKRSPCMIMALRNDSIMAFSLLSRGPIRSCPPSVELLHDPNPSRCFSSIDPLASIHPRVASLEYVVVAAHHVPQTKACDLVFPKSSQSIFDISTFHSRPSGRCACCYSKVGGSSRH